MAPSRATQAMSGAGAASITWPRCPGPRPRPRASAAAEPAIRSGREPSSRERVAQAHQRRRDDGPAAGRDGLDVDLAVPGIDGGREQAAARRPPSGARGGPTASSTPTTGMPVARPMRARGRDADPQARIAAGPDRDGDAVEAVEAALDAATRPGRPAAAAPRHGRAPSGCVSRGERLARRRSRRRRPSRRRAPCRWRGCASVRLRRGRQSP